MTAPRPERLIPVRSESELRIGMIVVVMKCKSCGDVERGMLIGRVAPRISRCPGHPDGCPARGWKTTIPCKNPTGPFDCLCSAISNGRLYRVDDGLTADGLATYRCERDIEAALVGQMHRAAKERVR